MAGKRNMITSVIKFLNNGCQANAYPYEIVCSRWFPRIGKNGIASFVAD